MERRSRAIVVDQLALARAGVAAVLRDLGFDELTETRSGRDAAAVAAMESPGLAVVGKAADLTVVETSRRILRARPAPIVVALLAPESDPPVGYLLAIGVRSIVMRNGAIDELAVAIEAALKGDQYVASGLHSSLAGSIRPRAVEKAGAVEPALTAREREVLAFLAEGRSNREIAGALSLSLATVKSHLVRIYAKLEAGNRNEALGRAVNRGLLG